MTSEAPAQRDTDIRVFGAPILRKLGMRQLRIGTFLFVAYLAATRIGGAFFAAPAIVFPAAGIAVGSLFLEGLYLWPFVYAAAFVGYVLDGATLVTILIMPVAHTLQAVVGAFILKRLAVDPILRRSRDIFSIILVALAASVIVPTVSRVVRYLNAEFYGTPMSSVTWFSAWAGFVLSVIILTPFVLRWFAKPHFTRTLPQILEIVVTQASVYILGFFLFWTDRTDIYGVSLGYVLFLPLFWIALRLGPRFLTLALLVLSAIAITGAFFGVASHTAIPTGTTLLQTEVFLVIVAIIFFSIVTIEEERRFATKLLVSQIGNLRVALDQLAEQDRAKNEFVAIVAHELRNPLTPVVASLDLLREKTKDEESLKTLSFMESCMLTTKRLLEDLLDVSRVNQKKLILKKEASDLVKVVKQAAASRKHTLIERDQTFLVNVPDHPIYANVDPVRIEQVVMNLLVNASKFTPPSGSISLTLTDTGNRAVIAVKDSGVGIEPSMLERIFEPFAQAGGEGERSQKGLGIGLALARELVLLHGGTVRAESTGKGHGSLFTVELPTVPQEAAATSSKKLEEAVRKTARGVILVVDDNDAAAYAVGRLLELKGYVAEYAYDGTHALERAREVKPDTILLDIGLPDMDGYTVAKKLRAEGFAKNLVALTGYGSPEEQQKAKESGFDHHLVKPIGIAELRRVL